MRYITYNLRVYNTCGLNGVTKQPEINNKNGHNVNNTLGDVTEVRPGIIIKNKEEKICI